MTRSIGIISIKGGVGKSSCASNIAYALALFDKKVLLIDANFSAPNIGIHFGLVDPDVTLHDVLTNKANISDAIHKASKNLHIIPGSLLNQKVNTFALREKVNKLRSNYDFIIIDSSPNLNNEMLAAMHASDELFVVTSPDYPTLSCTMNAVKVAKQRKTPIAGLILNRVRGKNFELGAEEIEENTGVPVVGVINEDLTIPESISYMKSALEHKPRSDASIEFMKLAAAITGEDFQDPRPLKRLKRLFFGEAKKYEVNRDLLRDGKLY